MNKPSLDLMVNNNIINDICIISNEEDDY